VCVAAMYRAKWREDFSPTGDPKIGCVALRLSRRENLNGPHRRSPADFTRTVSTVPPMAVPQGGSAIIALLAGDLARAFARKYPDRFPQLVDGVGLDATEEEFARGFVPLIHEAIKASLLAVRRDGFTAAPGACFAFKSASGEVIGVNAVEVWSRPGTAN
jgi:hypothetical protein